MDELEFYNGAMIGEEIDKRIVYVNCGTISSLNTTITNDQITERHVVISAVFGNPSAHASDWTVTTANGSFTISGTLNGTTTLNLFFAIPYHT